MAQEGGLVLPAQHLRRDLRPRARLEQPDAEEPRPHALVETGLPLALQLPGALRPEEHLHLHAAGAERAVEHDEVDERAPGRVLLARLAMRQGEAAAVDERCHHEAVARARPLRLHEVERLFRYAGAEHAPGEASPDPLHVLLAIGAGELVSAVPHVTLEERRQAVEALGLTAEPREATVGGARSGYGDGEEGEREDVQVHAAGILVTLRPWRRRRAWALASGAVSKYRQVSTQRAGQTRRRAPALRPR